MDDEELLPRPPPAISYRPSQAVLRLPPEAVRGTHALLQRGGPHESGALWYGPRTQDGSGEVKLVVAPRQRMSRFNYHIEAEAVAEIVRQLPPDWRPLAQVHSHPGHWVEHSRYDDRMAMSKRALSIVFPFYGRDLPAPFPTAIGVHEFQSDYWHLLEGTVARSRVASAEGAVQVADLRR